MPLPRPHLLTAATTQVRRTLSSTPAARRRVSRIPTLLTAAALLTLWGVFTLGWYAAALAGILTAVAAAVILTRRRPDITASAAIAATAVAVPLLLLLAGADHGRPIADLTPQVTFAVSGIVPTLAAWTCRPVISRPVNAAIGSLILLAGSGVQWFLGAAGHAVLYVSLLTAIAVIQLRYRRALHRRLHHLVADAAGWTDIGSRTLAHSTATQLFIGRGHAIPVFTHNQPDRPGPDELQTYVSDAAALADRLMLPPGRVQPVVLHRAGMQWHRELVNDGRTASSVPVGGVDSLPAIRAAFTAATPPWRPGPARLFQRHLDQCLVRRAVTLGSVT